MKNESSKLLWTGPLSEQTAPLPQLRTLRTASGVYHYLPERDMEAEIVSAQRKKYGRLSPLQVPVLPDMQVVRAGRTDRGDTIYSRICRDLDAKMASGEPFTVSLFDTTKRQTLLLNGALEQRYRIYSRVTFRLVDPAEWGFGGERDA